MASSSCIADAPESWTSNVSDLRQHRPGRVPPIVATVMRCDNPWHEDRIIKKPRHKSGEAAARQSQVFWPSGFTVHYSNG